MKKYVLIFAVIGLVGLTALLLFFGGSPADQKQLAKNPTPNAQHPAPLESSTTAPGATLPGTVPDESSAPTDEVTAANIPVPVTADINEAVFSVKQDAELKFLTTDQQKELDSAAVVKHDTEVKQEQAYTVTWKDPATITAAVPSLPESAPVYLLARPTDTRLFAFLKDIAASLGIKGSVIRTDNQNYAVANISTGDYYLFFDLFHLTFDAEGLAIATTGGSEGVKDALAKAGLLAFPNVSSEEQDPETGSTWYRFTPQLPLAVVSMDPPVDDSLFTPGKTGTVDVAVDATGSINEIRNSFPNITEKSSIPLATAEEIATRISAGSFRLGDVELQYPGAMPLEDKRKFFTLQNESNINIADAEVSKLECGYFVETDASVQALLSPVCIVNGKGRVDNYSVLFRTVVAVAK